MQLASGQVLNLRGLGHRVAVRTYFRGLSGWQVAVASGVPFGVLFALVVRCAAVETWIAALVAGAFTGPAFGLCMALVRRRERRLLEGLNLASLTGEEKGAAQKVAWRGPIPADPVVRTAAVELARVQVGRVGSWWFRVLAAVMLVVEVVASVLNLIDGRWLQTILTVAGALLFGACLFQSRHLRRRIAALSVD